ncbi:HAD family hydrolase [Marinibactrum halimedae]|uniref:Phosphoglycolate phosphatase 2 n=1 Tax=Marinibactrum halimedae TaxID=1444977 RepID=A0AA37WP86_9GAMM|nr:HAD-IA family hydrolase [Marinibactrum halimedae]MCD9459816.1 HAD-IA family hydrolase [Marinibactrum halimedae]GLS26991.1 phosphoglycolate phosphatase 2 [Marinibactrum halimedae]
MPISPQRAVLFDLDGTLMDTADDFVTVVNAMRLDYQQPPLDEQRIRATVSDGARALIKLAFTEDESGDEFQRLRQELLDRYLEQLKPGITTSTYFSGIEILLSLLQAHQIQWGIVTNKPWLYTDALLKALNISAPVVICPDHVSQTKPHPEPLFLACEKLRCIPEESIYVGDHIRDIEAGRAANMATVTAKWGYIKKEENVNLWEADAICESPQDLWPTLQALLTL